MTKGLALLVLSLCLCVTSQPAAAQEAWTAGDYTAWTSVNMARVHEEVADTVAHETSAPQATEAVNTSGAGLSYVPSTKRTQDNLAQFVARTRAQDAAAGADLARTFASVDLVGVVGEAMRSVGLDPHNVADAYAFWWVEAWSSTRMIESPNDAVTWQAVARQAREALAATSEMAKESDGAKQQLAEAMIVQGGIMNGAVQQARDNPAMRQQLASAARKGALAMGLNLDAMVLTPQGFRPR